MKNLKIWKSLIERPSLVYVVQGLSLSSPPQKWLWAKLNNIRLSFCHLTSPLINLSVIGHFWGRPVKKPPCNWLKLKSRQSVRCWWCWLKVKVWAGVGQTQFANSQRGKNSKTFPQSFVRHQQSLIQTNITLSSSIWTIHDARLKVFLKITFCGVDGTYDEDQSDGQYGLLVAHVAHLGPLGC